MDESFDYSMRKEYEQRLAHSKQEIMRFA